MASTEVVLMREAGESHGRASPCLPFLFSEKSQLFLSYDESGLPKFLKQKLPNLKTFWEIP